MNFVEKKLLNRILDFFSILKILFGYQKTISGLFLLKILVFVFAFNSYASAQNISRPSLSVVE